VVIDSLQRMGAGRRVESRQQEVSEFSRSLKLLAKELEIPVIAVAQLNRGPEQRTGNKPQKSDLPESRAPELGADGGGALTLVPTLAFLAAGLAGLRVGYSISHPQITQHLRVAATPFAVTALAEAAAIASIEHEDAVMERVSHLVAERERVTARLRELGYDFPSTYANFVWLPLGERTGGFVQLMSEHALSVRAFGTEGVRVSIGEVEANDRFLSLCEVFAKGL